MPDLGRCFLLASAVLASTAVAANAGGTRSYDGSYAGWMTEISEQPSCVHTRPVNMEIDGGSATIWYADAAGNVLHYRGAVDESGTVDTWHRNGDGTPSVLVGDFGGPGFFGYLDREDGLCRYKIILRFGSAS
jgi:hypothetical protein